MTVLQILQYPDERLRKMANSVEKIDDEIRQNVQDMLDTLYDSENGIGLAATQVNIHKNIFVMDLSENRDTPLVFINTEILEKSGETGMEEGCLSIPGCTGFVPRAERVNVRALDRNGQSFDYEAEGLPAICIQHEMDHLKGKMFIDYLSPLKQQRIRQKFQKLARQEAKKKV